MGSGELNLGLCGNLEGWDIYIYTLRDDSHCMA